MLLRRLEQLTLLLYTLDNLGGDRVGDDAFPPQLLLHLYTRRATCFLFVHVWSHIPVFLCDHSSPFILFIGSLASFGAKKQTKPNNICTVGHCPSSTTKSGAQLGAFSKIMAAFSSSRHFFNSTFIHLTITVFFSWMRRELFQRMPGAFSLGLKCRHHHHQHLGLF